jgi:predicted nucleic acid-binding protein
VIIADSNLIAYLLIPGDQSERSESVLKKDAEWAAPVIWRPELRNVLTLYMRHQGMTLIQAQQTISKAERFLQHNEFAVPSDLVLKLTAHKAISAYDAEFIILAEQLQVPLVTFDKALLRLFPKIAVHPDKL